MEIVDHILGVFIIEKDQIKDKNIYKDQKHRLENKNNFIKQLSKKYPKTEEGVLPDSPEFYKEIYETNMILTGEKLRNSTNKDNLITQSYSNIKEVERIKNMLSRRLEEWYGLFLPEIFNVVENNEERAELIQNNSKNDLMKKFNFKVSIGGSISDKDYNAIKELTKEIQSLTKLQEKNKSYLQNIMTDYCPNLLAVADVMIAAGLIEHCGSLKKLSQLTSSTIQVLGAEKALFRHLQKNTRPPKYGLIINHPLISKAPYKEKAKRARKLAAAINKAAKIDFFKGDQYAGYTLKEELDEEYNVHP